MRSQQLVWRFACPWFTQGLLEHCWSHALQSVTASVLTCPHWSGCSVKALVLNLHVACLMKQHDKLTHNCPSELIFSHDDFAFTTRECSLRDALMHYAALTIQACLPGCADQCILANMYLRSDLSGRCDDNIIKNSKKTWYQVLVSIPICIYTFNSAFIDKSFDLPAHSQATSNK